MRVAGAFSIPWLSEALLPPAPFERTIIERLALAHVSRYHNQRVIQQMQKATIKPTNAAPKRPNNYPNKPHPIENFGQVLYPLDLQGLKEPSALCTRPIVETHR